MLQQGQQVTRYRLDTHADTNALYETWKAHLATNGAPRVLRVALPAAGAHFDEWRHTLRLQQRVVHPTRSEIIDLTKHEDRPVAVTEAPNGPSLATWAKARPRRLGEVVALFHLIVSSVKLAHRAGVIHGVLDARRIIMTNHRGPFIPRLDMAFGQLAALLPLGLPCPEQGAAPLDERSDIYQLGAVLYEMFVRNPFSPDPLPATLEAARPDAPAELVDMVHRMLSPDPAKRPRAALDVLAVLEPLRHLAASEQPSIS
jgi:eukaryotic-like serine/threonine-protein kinase